MARKHPGEDIKNQLTALTQNLEWLKDSIEYDEGDEISDVFEEMESSISTIQNIADEVDG